MVPVPPIWTAPSRALVPPMVPEHRRLVRPKAPVPPRASAVFVQAALAVSVQVCLASTASQALLAVLAARGLVVAALATMALLPKATKRSPVRSQSLPMAWVLPMAPLVLTALPELVAPP